MVVWYADELDSLFIEALVLFPNIEQEGSQ